MTLYIGFEEELAEVGLGAMVELGTMVGLGALVGKGRRSPCELEWVSWSES